MITLAFYTGAGRPVDWIVRAWTCETVSHVELVCGTAESGGAVTAFRALGASPRDGGVRETWIAIRPGHWRFVRVPGDTVEAAAFIRALTGAPYDWPAIWGWHVLGWRGCHRPGAWLCSEIVAHAIGRPHLAHLNPGALERALT